MILTGSAWPPLNDGARRIRGTNPRLWRRRPSLRPNRRHRSRSTRIRVLHRHTQRARLAQGAFTPSRKRRAWHPPHFARCARTALVAVTPAPPNLPTAFACDSVEGSEPTPIREGAAGQVGLQLGRGGGAEHPVAAPDYRPFAGIASAGLLRGRNQRQVRLQFEGLVPVFARLGGTSQRGRGMSQIHQRIGEIGALLNRLAI